jgi:alanyl-tRNA synthetase
LFGEKYGDSVRVVDIGGYSLELCGGTHVENTARIGSFKILSEGGVAAGVRRIEAVTGRNALALYQANEQALKDAAALLKSPVDDVVKRLEASILTTRELQRELDKMRAGQASGAAAELLDKKKDINGVWVIVSRVGDADMNALREMGDNLKASLNPVAIVLAGERDGKVSLLAMATDDAVKAGANCGAIIKAAAEAAGGSGGGRPNMAQAGAKDAALLDAALDKARDVINKIF